MALLTLGVFSFSMAAPAQTAPAAGDDALIPYSQLNAIPEVPLSALSDQNFSADGRRALAIGAERWKHGETPHFIVHFTHNFIAASVATEAEFYFRYLMADMGVPLDSPGKNHLYIFEAGDDWVQFIHSAQLEEWTGAVTIGNELFVPRNPKFKFKGNALGHEIAHLLVHRFLGTQLPLWLEEGYAEDASIRGYAALNRTRGYNARPRKIALPAHIPLQKLTAFKNYPAPQYVMLFYEESRQLAGFLDGFGDKAAFQKLLKAMAGGTPFETALREAYRSRWLTMDDLENDFKRQK